MKPIRAVGLVWLGVGLLSPLLARSAGPPPIDAQVVVRGGSLIDGTGSPARPADIAWKDGRIVAIGADLETSPSARLIDATGLVVAPGFIDLHTHSDGSILNARTRSNANYLTQGVTTVVTGNCGSGPVDVGAFLSRIDAENAGTNVAHLVPHGAVRRQVLGSENRKATPDELRRMELLVESGMKDGAWGMSTGLIYVPSRYADTDELIALSKVVARHGGIYASHIRDEGVGLLESIDEAIRIGREGKLPVEISHLKASGRANWGLIREACARIEAARAEGLAVTADQYPYLASSTSLAAMVVPDWAQKSPPELDKLLADPQQGPRLRKAIGAALDRRDGGKAVRIARFSPKPKWVGRDLAAIACDENLDPVDVVLAVQKEGGAQAISFGMSEEDVRYAMARPYVATASDGGAHAAGSGDKPHPRSYGTFPRKVRYALDDKVLQLEQAIYSATGLPASVLGLPDRGVLRVGAVADVVVFDPARFRDTATFDDPTQHAPGVKALAINGVLAIHDGKLTGALAGRALRRHRDGPANRIIRAGSIWTGDPDRPRAQAIAIRDQAIVAVGSEQDVEPFRGPATAVLDLPDAFIVPGLVDAHAHMSQLGASLEQIDLRGVASLDEVARKVRERIAATPGDGWILGANWDQSLWPGGGFPTSAALDAVAPDRPVWLSRVDGHAGWANSEALRRAGVTSETQPPVDGQVIRDADDKPTGVFIDGAMGLVGRAVPASTREEITRQILAAQSACLKVGLTGIHDAGLSPLEIDAYRQLDRESRLRLRIYGMASPPSGKEVEFVSQPPPGRIGDRLTVRAIKLFMDGAMGSRGALLFEPYSDDPHNRGLKLIDEDVLRATTEQALRNGWQVCTHAIGDRGNTMVLDAYEAAQTAVPDAKDARLRVEHAQVVRRADVARFREGKIIASMQPSHASTDKRWADARLGAGTDRVAGAYAWGWFRDERVSLAFGSDFPVEIANPFWGIYAAITRRDEDGEPPGGWHPEHLLTTEEALRHFTEGSARASFEEGRFGRIAPGFQADLTIIDRNLFRVTPAEVLAAKVVLTIIAGRDETPR